MDKEYKVPVAFGDEKQPPGKMGTTTTSSSVASSSRVASAASAPVRLANRIPPTADQRSRGSFNDMPRNIREDTGTSTPDGDSFNSSPLLWNSSTPQRMRSRREFEQKIRHRRHRANPQNVRGTFDLPNERDGKAEGAREEDAPALPVPNALADLLLQTAMLGIDTTAKLTRPTFELTRNTLLPQLILPLIQEVWEQYVPDRVQTWMKVVPTSLKNVGDLLWDTEAGSRLGDKSNRLGESVVDVASSEVARQCWIDVTIALIKLLEGLHTPEVKALLDQSAVGMCRLVDVLSSGKAKQLWFDLSETIWALIEVGGDPVMVTSLADGCAKICFALERERESLKARRARGAGAGGGGVSNEQHRRLLASKRRRDRDRRQAETYPPGKQVVIERGGVEGFEEALLDGLDGIADGEEDGVGDNLEGQIYDSIDNIADDEGPPQRVTVRTSSMEDVEDGDVAITSNITNDDNESEITTEIEDLRTSKDQDNFDEVQTLSSASEKETPNRQGNELAYERDGKVEIGAALQDEIDQLEWHPDDDGTASEMYDAFDEPVLQFYRRLNEVLVETRKDSKLDLHHPARVNKRRKEEDKLETDADAASGFAGKDTSPTPVAALSSKGLFGVKKRWWKLLIVAFILGVATTCTLWFALGCYGFYVIFLGGGYPLASPAQMSPGGKQVSNIVIQLVGAKGQEMGHECIANNENDGVASITLEDWKKLKLDVDSIISQTSEKKGSSEVHL